MSIPPAIYERHIKRCLSPVGELLADPSVSEVLVSSWSQVSVERQGTLAPVEARFGSEQQLRAALNAIAQYVGRCLDSHHPILEARLPDGSRVAGAIPPATPSGATLAIRRFVQQRWTLESLHRRGAMTDEQLALLKRAVVEGKTMIVSGGTGSGKTSLLSALIADCPRSQRIVTLEDCRELDLDRECSAQLEAQPRAGSGKPLSLRELLRAALRLRPDRLVVGEVRGGEALDLLGALSTGHRGSLATLHASSAHGALVRLETLAMQADAQLPHSAVRRQVADCIDLVVQVSRASSGQRRITEIECVQGLSKQGDYALRPATLEGEAQDGL